MTPRLLRKLSGLLLPQASPDKLSIDTEDPWWCTEVVYAFEKFLPPAS